ncbi:MAG: right-handed parallel beta-helix repeat-containing protein, partial [Planctomycetota bacterium]
PTDKDGVARPLDGDGDGSAVADMGAYEYALNSPSIAVSAVSFYFVQDWPRPDPQTLQIRNCGGQPLQWEIVEDCSWLEAAPANGVSTNQINEVTLTVDPNGLMPGLYSYDFKVQDANASNSPVTIRVTVPVGTVLNVPSPNYPTIQSAIDAAGYYDVVVVADGNYTGDGNKRLDFRGKPITVCSENGPNNCTIDCQNSGNGFNFYNGERENSVVEGFTITNAGDDGITCDRGTSPVITNCTIRESSHTGVVSYGYSSPTITNCTISGNNCGIRCDRGSNATIKNCTISDNSEWRDAGGIYCWESSLEIVNCTISANNGRGIYGARRCSLEITNCTISENNGGGIYGELNHSVEITNCTISDNNNTGILCSTEGRTTITNCTINGNKNGLLGGGINCSGGYSTTISNCTISDNSAEFIGGVICSGIGITITNCIISGNSATDAIGGAFIGGESPTIANCIITGNTAERSGGLSCTGFGNPTITNCTIVGNSASEPEWGGGMLCYDSNPTITNCIFWGNEAPEGAQIYLTGSEASVSYTDIQGRQADVYVEPGSILNWGLGNIDLDPYFVDPNASDHHLSEDSPCIDAGDPNYVAGPDETDLDGNPRVFGERIDMGAYEFTILNTVPVSCIVGGDRAIEAGSGCEAQVTLDGSCSSDADSMPGTNDDIEYFDWYEGDTFLGSGEIIECNLPLGEHTIILEVIDKAGAFDVNEVTITVEDTTPPEFSLTVTPGVLWPPNHKMVKVTPAWEASDNCDELPEVTLVSITSNEGGGHTSDDIRVKGDGSIWL